MGSGIARHSETASTRGQTSHAFSYLASLKAGVGCPEFDEDAARMTSDAKRGTSLLLTAGRRADGWSGRDTGDTIKSASSTLWKKTDLPELRRSYGLFFGLTAPASSAIF
jgi:hypothetical protein